MFIVMNLTNIDIILRVTISVCCGILIGIERQLNSRIAGIHTNVLVSLGSCLLVQD